MEVFCIFVLWKVKQKAEGGNPGRPVWFLFPETFENNENKKEMKMKKMILTVGNRTLEVELSENTSVDALVKELSKGPVTVRMSDYGNMEKVGPLGQSLPRNDTQITTEAGDVILYQGNMLVIYYAPNSWSFTRLGKIKNGSAQSLKEVLGDGDVTVVLSLPSE